MKLTDSAARLLQALLTRSPWNMPFTEFSAAASELVTAGLATYSRPTGHLTPTAKSRIQ